MRHRAAPIVVALLLAAVPVRAAASPGAAAGAAEGNAAAPGASGGAAAQLNDEAFALYRDRDYRHAVEKFLQAYALQPDPNLLFNIARCYEALGEEPAATEKYRMFLAHPDADPAGRLRAAKALRSLEERQSDLTPSALPAALAPGQSLAPTPSTAPPAAPPPRALSLALPASSSSAAALDADAPIPPAATVETAPSPSTAPSWLRLTPATMALGAGVIAAAVGATLLILGRSEIAEVTGAPGYNDPERVSPMTEAAAKQHLDSGHAKQVAGAAALALGGGALATSAILFVWGGAF